MSHLEIIAFPHPILKRKAEPVAGMTPELRRLVKDMTETMYQAPGVGLAANQVGVAKQLAVLDVSSPEEPNQTIVLVNPSIVECSLETETLEEACLSVPGFRAEVERAIMVTVLAKNLEGEEIKLNAQGFLARVLQHEIDHLNGRLFIDRIGRLKRERYVKQRKQELSEAKKKK